MSDKKPCKDCNGQGKWLSIVLWHNCDTCGGTGIAPNQDESKENLDKDTSQNTG